MISRNALPTPMEVFAAFMGAGLGILYLTGDLPMIRPDSELEATFVGVASIVTSLVVFSSYLAYLYSRGDHES